VQISLHADYALRVLIYLGSQPGRVASTVEISEAYGISKHHLVRVVQTLSEHGYLRVTVGRSGGVSLAMAPESIKLGDVVRRAEPNLRLVECFDLPTNTCPIVGACRLAGVLRQALDSFLGTLNRYTLKDLLADGAQQKLASVFAGYPLST